MIDHKTAQIKVLSNHWMADYKSLIIKRRAGYIAVNQAIPVEQAKEKGRLDYITQ